MLLATALAAFFCISIGLAPGWLYGLLPAELSFRPYEIERTAPQLELLGTAGAIYLMLRAFKLAAPERPLRLLDVDAIYRGPAVGAGRWVGVVLLRVYGAWRGIWDWLVQATGTGLARLMRSCDQPYRSRLWGAAQFGTVAVAIALALLWGRL